MKIHSKKDVGAIVHSRGVTFRVWAPFANNVGLTGSFNNWATDPMANEGDGYWSLKVRQAEAGQEYKFVITNGDNTYVRNDPRALQLTTAAGNSVIVDPAFDWGDVNYQLPSLNQLVIYEMHIGTFHRPDAATTGTFEDAMAKLNHLQELGINVIELMPIASMSLERGWWGYVADYIYAVERLYGGRHQFLEFVKAAHQKGIGVLVDVVYNHLGPDENLDLWQFDGWSENGKGGIYFYNDWRAKTPWSETRPDYGRPEVQQYFIDNVKMWLQDCRVDGLRVDSTIFIRNAEGHNDAPDTDLADGWELLQNINSVSRKINPSALTIAEDSSGNEYITKPIDQGGAGFSTQWEVSLPHAFRSALIPNNTNDIDLTGLLGELGRTYNGDPFQRVVYYDSHDSTANGGARLNEQIHPAHSQSTRARQKSLVAAGLLLTMPGAPMLFQGQEFMAGGSFNDWQELDWTEAEQFSGIIAAFKHLVDLRLNAHGNTAGLTGRSINISHVDENNKVIAYHRWDKGGSSDDVIIIANFAKRHHPQYVLGWPRNGLWRVRFNSTWQGYSPDFKDVQVPDVQVDAGEGSVILPPNAVLILSQDK